MYCTMAHFSLGISANDLQVPGRHEEAILLLWGGLGEKGGQEHAQVKVQGLGPSAVNKAVKNCHGMGAWGECYGREASMRDSWWRFRKRQKRKKIMIHVSIGIQQVYFREAEHCPFLRPE